MIKPGSILKLWTKALKKHEADKDPKELPKKGQDQKLKIKKGLTTLKFQAAADLTQPDREPKPPDPGAHLTARVPSETGTAARKLAF